MSMADIYGMESPLIFSPLSGGSIRLAYRVRAHFYFILSVDNARIETCDAVRSHDAHIIVASCSRSHP